MKYLFVFGNTPQLSKAELDAVLPHFETQIFEGKILVLDSKQKLIADFFKLLGGTVKVGEVVENIDFSDFTEKKIDFGVSFLSKSNWKKVFDINKQIKEELTKLGVKARFVLPQKGETELSSVVVAKQKLTEFLVFNDIYARTIWVQDFEDWNRRDYGRPQVEAHIGMLPPKVARMMVNIAGGQKLLDPFCGVGTILTEGAMVGREVVGSDIDSRQVDRTKKNLDWAGVKAQLFVVDARKISEKVKEVDVIVTEPDLGPNDMRNIRQDMTGKLEKLYLDSLEDWKKVLKPGGTVVIALPFVKNVVDKAKAIGYILVSGPYEYARPQAKVKRNICVFKYGTY